MKILHLSDPHIGKSVNGFSMIEEQRHILRQVIGYVRSERPAALVIAGDVYDRAVPGVDAVRLFDDFLTDLAAENITVMVVAGNHDSPERLGYAGRLLEDKKLFICGAFDGAMRRVVMSDEYGGVNFWLLPFIRPSSVRGMFDGREIETHNDAVAAVIEAAGIDYSARNVLVSHQFYAAVGAEPARCESEINPVGGLDAVDAVIIERFDYAALGHLHRAQRVGGDNRRYAGSPLKYSFSEVRHEKSVSLVELGEKGALSVSALPLVPLHDMREISGPLSELISDEVSSLADKEDYLRVVLTDEEEIVDPMGKVRSVYPNVMALGFENARTGVDIAEVGADSEWVSALSPYDLFFEFFLDMTASAMNACQSALVRSLMDSGVEE
ncbi:exonuclease SbcD [Fibrobacteres bacterium R8-0-B4]